MSVSPPEPPTEPQHPSHWAFMGGLCRCLFILPSPKFTSGFPQKERLPSVCLSTHPSQPLTPALL